MVRGFVAPRSRPWGSPRFGLPDSASQPSLRPEGRGPEGPSRNLPLWRGPFEAFPSSAAVDHAVTAPRPFGRGRVHRLAFPLAVGAVPARVSPRRAALLSTSGLSSTEESVAFVGRCHPATARCSLGLWIDSFPDAAARIALPSSRWTFRLAARTASASPHPNVKGRQGVSALSGSLRPASSRPRRDGRARSRWLRRVSRRSRLGRIPDGPRRGCQWICPEERSTASVRIPEGIRFPTSSRRISEETRSRPSVAPKSGGRWFELLPSVLPRLPAYMMERPLAADTHARRRVHLRATRAHPRGMLRRTRPRRPEGRWRRASRRHHPEVGPWRLVTPTISSKLEVPAQGQTVVVFTGTAETRSEDEVSPPIRRSE